MTDEILPQTKIWELAFKYAKNHHAYLNIAEKERRNSIRVFTKLDRSKERLHKEIAKLYEMIFVLEHKCSMDITRQIPDEEAKK